VRPSNAAKVVALAVDGIARACVDDPEERLVRLLRDGIDVVAAFAPLAPPLAPAVVPWATPGSAPTTTPVSANRTTPAGQQPRTLAR